MTRLRLVMAWCVLETWACNGTETGNPPAVLDAFDTSSCKTGLDLAAKRTAAPRQGGDVDLTPAAALEDPRYQGLRCFLWERRDARTLRLQVTNHREGCGENEYWEPYAELKDDGLALYLDNPSCTSAGCDQACTYDLSFDLQVPETSAALQVSLYGDACSGDPMVRAQVALPVHERERGESCEYMDAATLNFYGCFASMGSRFAPCGTTNSACPELDPSCQDGLVCSEVAPADARCLLPCGDDQDCAGIASTHCEGNVCVL